MKTPAFWSQPSTLGTLLTPLSWVYGIGAALDRRFTMPEHARVKTISIGNVTVGGAGKTPTTLALAPMLYALGAQPHVLTRGYQGMNHRAHRVRDSDDWRSVGDEALLLARVGPTWVGRDRLAAAAAAVDAGATLLVCDDALQHHRLAKDISLLVIDGPYGIGNGKLLPAGPLREPFTVALKRTDAIILIGPDRTGLLEGCRLPIFRAELKPSDDTAFLSGKRWVAFAGIGRPEKFFDSLRKLGADLATTHSFPDHHGYTETDLSLLQASAADHGAALITTEKDAVKLPPGIRDLIRVLPVTLTFDDRRAVEQFLEQRLA